MRFLYNEHIQRWSVTSVNYLSEDLLIQDELQALWGNSLTALTPKQRKMVLDILKQTKTYSKIKQKCLSSKIINTQVCFYSYGCF